MGCSSLSLHRASTRNAQMHYSMSCVHSGSGSLRLADGPQSQSRRAAGKEGFVMRRPDDFHLHLRDGDALKDVVPLTTANFSRAVIMPNLLPPVTTTKMCVEYKQRILSAVPAGEDFTPLMTLYLTDNTPPDEVRKAKEAGVVAFKLYPAGATTNSDSGVTSIDKVLPTIKAIAEADLLLLVHGEVTDPNVDMFDREKEFIGTVLVKILDAVPNLRLILEHITTKEAVEFVEHSPFNVAATITPQHIAFNRNKLFAGGLRPHHYCLPILKREEHRLAVASAATSGNEKFFLGTDSAPHPIGAKESSCGCAGIFSAPVALSVYAQVFEEMGALDKLESFASINGANFYGLPPNPSNIAMRRETWSVPESYKFGSSSVVPLFAGSKLDWKCSDHKTDPDKSLLETTSRVH